MKESLLDLKCTSMKYNLVFTGLEERPYVNTDEKICGFIGQELGIEHWIAFGNFHRFGPRKSENENMWRKGYPIHRPIVARFIYHRELAYVLVNAYKMKGKPFGIKPTVPARSREQAETTISSDEKARDNGHFTRMVRDKLYIGQELGIEHWIEFGNVHRFGQRNPENENISKKRLSDPQTDSRLLDLSQGFGICPRNAKN
jgi:hypothetical protein